LGFGVALLTATLFARGDDAADAKRLIEAHVAYLCSEALEGRGLGSQGLESAAGYIAERFREYGLKTSFQEFDGAMVIQLGPKNRMRLVGPEKTDRIELVLGEDYIPLTIGGSGKVSLPLAFAGYGISSPEKGYDDYQGLELAGRAAVLFDARAPEKIHNWKAKELVAAQRGAKAVVFTYTESAVQRSRARMLDERERTVARLAEENKRFRAIVEPSAADVNKHLSEMDSLLSLLTQAQGILYDMHEMRLSFANDRAQPEAAGIPIIRIRRSVIDRVLASAAKTDVAALEKKIAEELKPQSMALAGWTLEGEVDVQRTPIKAKNVIAVAEGADALAEQTIVLGAHYDGVGYRDIDFFAALDVECPIIAPKTRYNARMAIPKALHPAANDNASGTAVLLEVARRLAKAEQSPRRRVVFIAFSAEEIGYIGSKAYVRQPLFPLEKTVAMINMDLVGRLQGGRMNVFGAAPAGIYGQLLDQLGPGHQFKFNKLAANRTSLDQAAFERQGVPTLYFATGPDPEMHLTGDRPDRLNYDGMRQVSEMLAEYISALATTPKRPEARGP
jgi:hypothetical protein